MRSQIIEIAMLDAVLLTDFSKKQLFCSGITANYKKK